MNLTRDKIFSAAAASALFAIAIFFLPRIFQERLSHHTSLLLASCIILSFNAIIVFAFFAFGRMGGAAVLLVSILTAFLLGIIGHSPVFYPHIVFFIATAFISRKWLKGLENAQTEYLLNIEKISEEVNTLSEKLQKDKQQASSMEIKQKRYSVMKTVVEHLSGLLSEKEITRFLADKSFEMVGKSARALIYLVDAESKELRLVRSSLAEGLPKVKAKKGDIFDRWVLRQGQPLITLDVANDFRFSRDDITRDEAGFRSLISVPMISHNKMIGLLRLDSRAADAYNPDDLRLLDIIGDLGAVSLHNNMLYQRTTELAITDGLTQLFVHHYFMERLEPEIKRALHKGHCLSVLMMDIDHFKDYNDKYGHIAGDILLKHLSALFKSVISKGDIIARYGGEEFAAMLFDEDKEAARNTAEKIRRKVEEKDFYLRRQKTRATVSIGIATFPGDAKSARELLKVSDRNLYCAKREGRNRVCVNP